MDRPVPTGDDVNEWRLWLLENTTSDVPTMAAKLAAKIGMRRAVAGTMPGDDDARSSPSSSWPRITGRRTTRISPWVTLIAREVEFSPGTESETYHSIGTFDYVIVLALTPEGEIPLVRQYRPAVEDFTFEFPGGIIDTAEGAASTATRELFEETGFASRVVTLLGVTTNDAGRLGNRVHSYFIETETQTQNFRPESGMEICLVTPPELVCMIATGAFNAQANLGTLLLAVLRGVFRVPS